MNRQLISYVILFLVQLAVTPSVPLWAQEAPLSQTTQQKITSTLRSGAQTVKQKAQQVGTALSTVPGSIKETFSKAVQKVGQTYTAAHTAIDDFCTNLLPRKDILEIIQQVGAKDAFSDNQASVRRSNSLPEAELHYLQARTIFTKIGLQKLLKEPLTDNQMPRIALCFSGGGYRAMIETLGALAGAQKTGLLDATTYISGLSGSTWAINPWILSGLSASEYLNGLQNRINKALPKYLPLDKESIKQFIELILRKNLYNEHIGITDFYGALLANTLLQGIVNPKQFATLSALASKVQTGGYPLPISTAVLGLPEKSTIWFEFTPFEIGSDQEKAFIPTWSFGRKFSNGLSLEVPHPLLRLATSSTNTSLQPRQQPQQTLGYLMGTWGSAFAVNFSTVIRVFLQLILHDCSFLRFINPQLAKELAQISQNAQQAELIEKQFSATVSKALDTILSKKRALQLKTERLGAAKVFNFIPGQENTLLPLVDGGYDLLVTGEQLNIALIPLLAPKRAIDLIIILDSSGSLEGAPALKAAQQRAIALGLPFPVIPSSSYKEIGSKPLSVFSSTIPGVPTLIYMPAIKTNAYDPLFDPTKAKYTSTPNFTYKPEQIQQLSGLTKFIFEQQHQAIVNVIRQVSAKKSRT